MRLIQITPPAVEPVSIQEAKQHARIEYPDDDTLVAGLISSARIYCETALRSVLITQAYTLYLDSFPSAGGYYNRAIRELWPSLGGLPSGLGFYPGMIPNSTGVIDIPVPPLQSLTSVQYWDFAGVLQTFDPAQYNVSLGTPGRIQPAYSKIWPIARPTIDSVQVNFVAGYGDATKTPQNVKVAICALVAHWYENREAVSQGSYAPVPLMIDALLSPSEPGIYA
jgi:hypothetical protein